MNVENFKIALIKRKISQNALARELGFKPQKLSAIVLGHQNAAPSEREQICDALKVKQKDIFPEKLTHK